MGHSLNTQAQPFCWVAGALKKGFCLLLACAVGLGSALSPLALLPAPALAWGEFTVKDEKELGKKFNVLIRARMPLVQDPEIVQYVESIVDRLSKAMPPQPFPFTASVIRHNAINAFACPGGYIFVHTGLIMAMQHESEVAGVIAHEMGHVTQRHIARRIEQSQWVGILSLLGALAGAFLGGDAGGAAMAGSMAAGQATMLSYSRANESEADQVGMSYLTKAGYPPHGMVGAFEILSHKQWFTGGTVPSYLATHPGITDRISDMSVRLARLPAAMRNKKDDDRRFLRVQALVRARYGDPEPAAREFEKQMTGPTRCMALMGQGILSARQNRINDATSFFDQALACAPKDELIVREAGRFHYIKGNRNKGVALLQQAVSMDRNDSMALYYYGLSLADAGMTDKAIEYITLVQRTVPEDSELYGILARLYGEKGQMFRANLYMAYSALYENNKKRTEQFRIKAKDLARTPDEKAQMDRFEADYKERREFW